MIIGTDYVTGWPSFPIRIPVSLEENSMDMPMNHLKLKSSTTIFQISTLFDSMF